MESSNFSQQEDPSKKGPPSEEKWEEDTDLAVFFEDLSKLDDYELSEDGLSTHEVSSTTSAARTPSGTQKPATSIDATATVASFKAAAGPPPPPQVRVLHSQGNWNITTPQNSLFKIGAAMVTLFTIGMLLGWASLKTPNSHQQVQRNPQPLLPSQAISKKPTTISPSKNASPDSQAAVETTAPALPSFALQVAACRSPSCLARYRQLLASRVSTEKIHIRQRADIQQLRIGPLAKNEAQSLKNHLATAEPQLAQAFLIQLR